MDDHAGRVGRGVIEQIEHGAVADKIEFGERGAGGIADLGGR